MDSSSLIATPLQWCKVLATPPTRHRRRCCCAPQYESEDGSGGKWIALEFKSTLLRVGSPWANCSAGGTDDYSQVSSLIPVAESARFYTYYSVSGSCNISFNVLVVGRVSYRCMNMFSQTIQSANKYADAMSLTSPKRKRTKRKQFRYLHHSLTSKMMKGLRFHGFW